MSQNITEKQKAVVIYHMRTHSELAAGRFVGNDGKTNKRVQWDKVLVDVNKNGPPEQTIEQVQRQWNRLKAGAKDYNANKVIFRRIKGNPVDDDNFKDPKNDAVLQIVGTSHKNGFELAKELGVTRMKIVQGEHRPQPYSTPMSGAALKAVLKRISRETRKEDEAPMQKADSAGTSARFTTVNKKESSTSPSPGSFISKQKDVFQSTKPVSLDAHPKAGHPGALASSSASNRKAVPLGISATSVQRLKSLRVPVMQPSITHDPIRHEQIHKSKTGSFDDIMQMDPSDNLIIPAPTGSSKSISDQKVFTVPLTNSVCDSLKKFPGRFYLQKISSLETVNNNSTCLTSNIKSKVVNQTLQEVPCHNEEISSNKSSSKDLGIHKQWIGNNSERKITNKKENDLSGMDINDLYSVSLSKSNKYTNYQKAWQKKNSVTDRALQSLDANTNASLELLKVERERNQILQNYYTKKLEAMNRDKKN